MFAEVFHLELVFLCFFPPGTVFSHLELFFSHLELVGRWASPLVRRVNSEQHAPQASLVLQWVDVEVHLKIQLKAFYFSLLSKTYWWTKYCKKMRHCCDSGNPSGPHLWRDGALKQRLSIRRHMSRFRMSNSLKLMIGQILWLNAHCQFRFHQL